MMKIKEKTRKQLLKEIDILKVKITRLEKAAGKELSKGARFTAPDISKQKKSEIKLLKSGDYLGKLINSIWDTVFVVKMPERVIEWANESFRIYGYDPGDCIGKNTSFFYPDKAGYLNFENKLKDAMAAGKDVLHTRHLFKKKSGESFMAEISATFYQENKKLIRVVGVFRDINEQIEKEEILLLTQASVDNLTDAVYWMGPDARFSYVNNAAVVALGYSREELLSMSVHDIDPDFPVETWPAHWKELKEKKSLIVNSRHQRKDKNIFPVEITAYFIQYGEKEINCAIAKDVTARKLAEKELAKHRLHLEKTVRKRTAEIENQSKKLEESQRALTFLLEDVNEARIELEQTNMQIISANKEMESFTYSVSHDLRAPLRAILGFSNKFTDIYAEKVDKEGKRLLNVINKNTKKMGMLIDDLLDFSRMGRSEMRKAKVDIKALVHETWNEQKDHFSDRQIELTIKDLPMVNGDRNMLRQVLFNLLSNAAKFSKNEKISKIEVGYEEGNSETIYYVKDNGAGFDMKYIEKLFQVFQRLHSDREFEGTGVGLAIVQRVITRHSGRVWAKSSLNKGATIYFSLPK